MATNKRIADEPAFVLHRYDWSESSLILEVFTRHYGRVALLAKGVKRPTSSFRPVLLPLQPLHLAYGGDAEIRTLRSAEWQGGHVMPSGEALLSGYYLNELLLNLLARDDPHAELFDVYAQVVRWIATEGEAGLPLALRAFELYLLQAIGVLPALNVQTLTRLPLQPDRAYTLVAEGGLREAHPDDRHALTGSEWLVLQAAFDTSAAPLPALMRACAPVLTGLKTQLRALLHYHCGVQTLRTRQMMMDIQSLVTP